MSNPSTAKTLRSTAWAAMLLATALAGVPATQAETISVSVEFACATPNDLICTTHCLDVDCYIPCTLDCPVVRNILDAFYEVRDCVRQIDWCLGIDFQELFDRIIELGNDLVQLLLPIILQAIANLPNTINGVLAMVDADGDKIPDAAEASLCGRQLIRNTLDAGDARLTGRCATASDYNGPSQASVLAVVGEAEATATALVAQAQAIAEPWIATAEGLAEAVIALVLAEIDFVTGIVLGLVTPIVNGLDADGDLIPDAVEPTLCTIEDQNTPLDGHCVGNNYSL